LAAFLPTPCLAYPPFSFCFFVLTPFPPLPRRHPSSVARRPPDPRIFQLSGSTRPRSISSFRSDFDDPPGSPCTLFIAPLFTACFFLYFRLCGAGGSFYLFTRSSLHVWGFCWRHKRQFFFFFFFLLHLFRAIRFRFFSPLSLPSPCFPSNRQKLVGPSFLAFPAWSFSPPLLFFL